MTVTSTVAKIAVNGTGADTNIPVGYKFLGPDDLVVIQKVVSTGVETTMIRGTHYTVSGGGGGTGTVTVIDGATNFVLGTMTWTIRRSTPKTQETDYVENDDFPAETHEAALDKATFIDQEFGVDLDRSIKVPISDPAGLTTELPDSVSRASKLVGFDSVGNVIATSQGLVDTATVSSYGATLIVAATSDAARDVLGIETDVVANLPGTADAGDLFFATDTGQSFIWNGSIWLQDTKVAYDTQFIEGFRVQEQSPTTARITGGAARDEADTYQGSKDPIWTKTLNTTGDWVEGDTNNMVPAPLTGSIANASLPVFAIFKPDGTTDYGVDTATLWSGPNTLLSSGTAAWTAGYRGFRRIGWLATDGSSQLVDCSYTDHDDFYFWNPPRQHTYSAVSAVNPSGYAMGLFNLTFPRTHVTGMFSWANANASTWVSLYHGNTNVISIPVGSDTSIGQGVTGRTLLTHWPVSDFAFAIIKADIDPSIDFTITIQGWTDRRVLR